MSGMIKSLRSGADRAAFEAGKLVRIQRVQSEQRSLELRRRALLEELGDAVWRLYTQGRVSDPELVDLCRQIQSTSRQVAELRKTATQLRQQQAASPMKCSQCDHELSPEDDFCPFCGAKTQAAAPAQPHAGSDPVCSGCGRTLRPGSVFCSHCGSRQAGPA